MHFLVAPIYKTRFERWRTSRQTLNSQQQSFDRLAALLESTPQLTSFDTPLRRLLRALMPRIDSPNTPLSDELELLATLGLSEIDKCPTENDSETPSDVSREQSAFVAEIVAFTELSHRYWALHDSQEKVKKSGANAVRKDIASAGGEARRDSLKPLREKVERTAYKGLVKSTRQRYGIWNKYEDMAYDVWMKLEDTERKRVKPSTVLRWIKAKYPKLTDPHKKRKKTAVQQEKS